MRCQSILFIPVLILILLRMIRIVSLFIVREGLIWDVYGACMLEWKIIVKLLLLNNLMMFKDYYGTEVSYRRAWMGVEKARGLVFGDYSSSFDDLRWYVDTTNDCNLGSVFDMEFDIDSKGRHFKCLFVAFEVCIHGFKYCRPVLMLDETFLKGRHKGCLLAATAKDGNQVIFCVYLLLLLKQ